MLLQRQSTSLRPITTAHLAQTMSLLELTSAELRQKIESALSNNPALEMVEQAFCQKCGKPLRTGSFCSTCFRLHEATDEQSIVFLSTRSDFYTPRGSYDLESENNADDYTASFEQLPQYVLRQIAPELEPEDRLVAAHILTSLDEDGLLSIPLVEIARYRSVPLSKVERVLRLIQHADPLGVGSLTPQAALEIQLEVLAESKFVPALAMEAVSKGLDLLSRKRYAELAKLLGISKAHAQKIAQFIVDNLNPYPARSHWGETANQRPSQINSGVYYAPDIIITKLHDKDESPLVVEIALPIRGTLRINPLFVEAIENAPAEKNEAWKADLEQATLLVKCLQQRNHTMVRMVQLLTHIQRKFILHGEEQLQPLTRANLAKILELHESTISRAVSDKAVQMPNGHIIPMSRFFDRSLHVRTALKHLIEQETMPLSDMDLVDLLAKQGYSVARRTVAKYRSMEGILPAHLRMRRTQPAGSLMAA
jgi:RNA polymerase sigma-54 factor